MEYGRGAGFAEMMDAQDALRGFRSRFHFPLQRNGRPYLYFLGNSLGLQPKSARDYVEREMQAWATTAINGFFTGDRPWMNYGEMLAEKMVPIVGAKPSEVVLMNSLTVNIHLMLVSFYRPEGERRKILMEHMAFPSDRYAVQSQAKLHGFDPAEVIIELQPRPGEATLRTDDILETLEREGRQLALVFLGGVNYYTGQAFDMERITAAAQAKGCAVGYDLAHAAGNIELKLHDWNADFATWCTYKYLNSGPAGVGGCFVHERHGRDPALPRLAGWWGHDRNSRFLMGPGFQADPGAAGWQLSNAPLLQMAALEASLDIFAEAGMNHLVEKSRRLTGYLEFLLECMQSDDLSIITPRSPGDRGCQLTIRIRGGDKSLTGKLDEAGVVADWREPDAIRIAPSPLYNSFSDVYACAGVLAAALHS